MDKIKPIIIGAGPAGLAMAGRLSVLGLPFDIIEQANRATEAWHNHYDRLHLHTVKQFSALPHMDFPKDYPTYVPREKLIEYFENYIQKFNITPLFNMEATSIERKNNLWEVRTKSKVFTSDKIIIATGVNRKINIPEWPGMSEFEGEIIHSRNYKNPFPFQNKKVLVVGMGNTGAEVAFDLSEYNVKTHLSVRGEVSIVPRDINGQPVQLTAKKLEKLPLGLGSWIGNQIRKTVIGDLSKYGLKISKIHPADQLKKTGKTPVIDIGTTKAIKNGKIIVHPGIDKFTKKGVVFADGKQENFDVVLLATGYKAAVNDFLKNTRGLLDNKDLPKEKIGKGEREGLYFLGFDNYKVGGILGTIKDDSLLILNDIISA